MLPHRAFDTVRAMRYSLHRKEGTMEAATERVMVESPLEFDEMVRDTRAEALFTEWGLVFELDAQFPLLRLKLENATQIRAEENRAPNETVDQYTTHMKHGAQFPPIVVA